MKLLTFAHRGEAQAFLSEFSFKPVDFFFDGLLISNDYFLLITGEGPHSASEKTISVLAHYSTQITHVFNLGVAGSLVPQLKLHDLVWIRTSYAHHAEKCEFKSFSSKNPKAINDCMTAFSRVIDLEEKTKLSHFANIVDRELWAVASAAHLFKKSFNALKIISDELTNEKLDICQFVKDEAPLFSKKLLDEFILSEKDLTPKKALKAKEGNDSILLSDPLFYFTVSQSRKLHSTLEGLALKGFSEAALNNETEVSAIKVMDKLPKERARLLLLHLSEKLNPISVKIRKSLEAAIAPLEAAKIQVSYDSTFEEDWLNINLKIQSSRDLEKVKNALKIFSYEDYKKIFDGNFDV